MEYGRIFTMWDVDSGKISPVKYSIMLTDNTPFKEHYQHIPPRMYEKV